MYGESPFKKTRGLKGRIWECSRNLKFIVDVTDQLGKRTITPTTYCVSVKETGNHGCPMKKRNDQAYMVRRRNNGTWIKEDCYLYFDRDYSDDHHLEVLSCTHEDLIISIKELKKQGKNIENIPFFQINLKPKMSYT